MAQIISVGVAHVTNRTRVRFWVVLAAARRETVLVDGTVPPGWPPQVRPPGAPDWERTAVAWLFDLVPPDYRAHEVLRRYPVLLARFAGDHVAAGLEAARKGWRTVRVELADQLPADAIEAAMTAYEREGTRLSAAARGVEVVSGALQGERWVPRL
jgi:hypothetical protein